jgi:hypothetical protein
MAVGGRTPARAFVSLKWWSSPVRSGFGREPNDGAQRDPLTDSNSHHDPSDLVHGIRSLFSCKGRFLLALVYTEQAKFTSLARWRQPGCPRRSKPWFSDGKNLWADVGKKHSLKNNEQRIPISHQITKRHSGVCVLHFCLHSGWLAGWLAVIACWLAGISVCSVGILGILWAFCGLRICSFGVVRCPFSNDPLI